MSDQPSDERPCLIFDIAGTLAEVWPIEKAVLVSMLGAGYAVRLEELHGKHDDLYELYVASIAAPAMTECEFRPQYKAACEELARRGALPAPGPLPSAGFVTKQTAQRYVFVFATGGLLCEARHVLHAVGLLDFFDEEESTARDAGEPPERRAAKSSGVPLAWIQHRHPECILVTDSQEDRKGAEAVGIPVVMVGADAALTSETLALAKVAKADVPRRTSAPRVTVIQHARFGTYDQLVGEQDEVGYESLAGQPDGRHGWNMPRDFATDELRSHTGGRILEIGCGDGSRVVIPALRSGAPEVIALDVNADLLAYVRVCAERDGVGDRLTTLLVPKVWWARPVWLEWVAERVRTVDLVVARQVLQFGTVEILVNVLRLADDVLADTGRLWMQNMSPYLQYLFELPWGSGFAPAEPGAMIEEICARNAEVEDGAELPEGRSSLGSAAASPWVPLVANFDNGFFLWFDDALLRGALERAALPLVVMESYFFSPAQIWVRNKLVGGREDWREKELHVALIGRSH